MSKKINCVLVTGGAGYIGSHTVLILLEQGYKVVVVDNFLNSVPDCNGNALSLARVEQLAGGKKPIFQRLDLCDLKAVEKLFDTYEFDCVMHFAGVKAVGESVQKPLFYYRTNMMSTINLLKVMKARPNCAKNFIFSSSCTVYGDPQELPVKETTATGESLTNPYGRTKHFQEQLLMDLCVAEKEWNVILLRYFNPVGAHPSGDIGEDPQGVPNCLMPFVAQVAVGKLPKIKVFGNDYDTPDGTDNDNNASGVRDYLHVMDCAKGHTAAVQLLDKQNRAGCQIYNLGTGTGYSVLEMITAFEKACGRKLPYAIEPRRSGDIAKTYCDPTKALVELGWKAEYNLEDMCKHLWNWQQKYPNGYLNDTTKDRDLNKRA